MKLQVVSAVLFSALAQFLERVVSKSQALNIAQEEIAKAKLVKLGERKMRAGDVDEEKWQGSPHDRHIGGASRALETRARVCVYTMYVLPGAKTRMARNVEKPPWKTCKMQWRIRKP